MTEGRNFRKEAPTQRALVALLEASPLPWTYGMIYSWFGWRKGGWIGPFGCAIELGRIKQIERGLYTARRNIAKRKPSAVRSPKIIVTDDMLKRYGFNL